MRTKEDLNPKELAFCRFYTALGEQTCGNAMRSAEAAGYSPNGLRTSSWRLMQRPAIRQKIRELHNAVMDKHLMNPSRILHDLEHTRLKALEKDDLAVATRCSELQGKYLAMFKQTLPYFDETTTSAERPPNLTKAQQESARKNSLRLVKEIERGRQVG